MHKNIYVSRHIDNSERSGDLQGVQPGGDTE